MANENINKVIYGDQTLIDLTSDTVTPSDLMAGVTAHDASGEIIVGTATRNGSNKIIKNVTLTFSGLTATISDSDIKANSDYAVVYYNPAYAEAAGITTESSNGTITFTATTSPQNTITCDVVIFGADGGTVEDSDLPSYYESEFNTTKSGLINIMASNPLVYNILFMTDLHFSSKDGNYYPNLLRDPLFRTIKAAKKFMAQMPVDLFVLGGDYMQFDANNTTKQMGIDNITELNEMVNGSIIPTFLLSGNHDAHYNGGTGVGLSGEERFCLLSRKNISPYKIYPFSLNTFAVVDDMSGFCYVFISTSSAAETASAVNADWANVRLLNSNHLPVVIFNHFGSTDAITDDVDSSIKTCIDTIKTAGDTIVAWVSGHKHFDWVHVYNDTLVISILNSGYWTNEQGQDGQTYNKTAETANESAFSVISIVPSTGKLYVTRFGAGVDFECNYNTTSGAIGRIGYLPTNTHTVTRTLAGGTASSNSANTVADGSSYTTTITVPDNHFTLGTVTVAMGGTDITSTAYNASTHVISIPSVTDDIVITGVATHDYYYAACDTTRAEQYNNSKQATVTVLEGNSFTVETQGASSGLKFFGTLNKPLGTSGFQLKLKCDNVVCNTETPWGVKAYFYDANGDRVGSNVDFVTSSVDLTSLITGRNGWISASVASAAVTVEIDIYGASSATLNPMTATFTNMRFE